MTHCVKLGGYSLILRVRNSSFNNFVQFHYSIDHCVKFNWRSNVTDLMFCPIILYYDPLCIVWRVMIDAEGQAHQTKYKLILLYHINKEYII